MKNKKITAAVSIILLLLIGYYGVNRISLISAKRTMEDQITKNNTISEGNIAQEAAVFSGERTLYSLDIVLDTKNKILKGHEVVNFKNKYNTNLKELVFHLYPDSYNSAETMPTIGSTIKKLTKEELGDIKIDSLKINSSAAMYTENNQLLKTNLSKELKPGETIQIVMDFTLKIPRGRDRLSYNQEQYSLTNWYPILSIFDEKANTWDENPFYPVGESNYSDCSDYEVILTVPKGMLAATTGFKVSEESTNNRDKLTFQALNNRDFVLFISKDYKVLSKEVDGIRVNSYYISEETTAKRMLDLASASIKYFGDTFGKYPYPEYDVVETWLQGGAMEYPTITQMGPYSYLTPEYNENNLTFFDEAVVHETAHQWWFSTVGNNEFKEPILDESFTAYSTALFFEKLYGQYSLKAVKASFLAVPISSQAPINRPTDKFNWQDFSTVVYRLAPAVLEDLRQSTGNDKFIDIFRTYYDRYKFKNATLDGFLEIVKEKAGDSVMKHIKEELTSQNFSNSRLLLDQEELNKVRGGK